MDSELHATEVKCRDGVTFRVHAPGPRLTIVTAPDDEHTRTSGLSAYRTKPATDGFAQHIGMPVEIVRAYCRVHGGVAQIGQTAQRLLQALPSQADPVMGAPVTDSRAPAVEEAAPEAPLPPARGATVAGRTPAEVAPRALAQHVVEAAPTLEVDYLTPLVIEGRKAVAQGEAPLDPTWGYEGASPFQAALERRAEVASLIGGRLEGLARMPRNAAHPLREEALSIAGRLAKVRATALAALDDPVLAAAIPLAPRRPMPVAR